METREEVMKVYIYPGKLFFFFGCKVICLSYKEDLDITIPYIYGYKNGNKRSLNINNMIYFSNIACLLAQVDSKKGRPFAANS